MLKGAVTFLCSTLRDILSIPLRGRGELNMPHGIALDKDAWVWVSPCGFVCDICSG